jgi:hypothetical protein
MQKINLIAQNMIIQLITNMRENFFYQKNMSGFSNENCKFT